MHHVLWLRMHPKPQMDSPWEIELPLAGDIGGHPVAQEWGPHHQHRAGTLLVQQEVNGHVEYRLRFRPSAHPQGSSRLYFCRQMPHPAMLFAKHPHFRLACRYTIAQQ